MKKPARKLVLCRETLRTLNSVELAHVAGALMAPDSGAMDCPREAAPVVPLVETT